MRPLCDPMHGMSESVQWQPASSGFCTLNIDDVVALLSSFGTTGDRALGVYEGLRLAWAYGFERIQLQFDCAEAIKILSKPLLEFSASSLVRTIACLLHRS
ncbi:hypothetical protein V6N11_041935 [Hibiscus sabdariffa]|uniref:RNase H type-1 domain-containing protein n=1 Tax=Hibiscus sabdariffa TaxID=183260 RepID=A0ABR2N766_9ROSI